jgi:hypothetical protein
VLDADDTTLWTYDMEDADMHFSFDPKRRDVEWVQKQRFPATPGMVDLVNEVGAFLRLHHRRPDRAQRRPEAGHDRQPGEGRLRGLHLRALLHQVDRRGQQPAALLGHVRNRKCTTIEYKSQTRKHVEKDLGYDIVANFGDLIGGHADRQVKAPNPTYYLP